MTKENKGSQQITAEAKRDRRLLPDVPDSENRRRSDRRAAIQSEEARTDADCAARLRQEGQRYITNYKVKLRKKHATGPNPWLRAQSVDTSSTGMMVEFVGTSPPLKVGDEYELRFEIVPGSMPEGYEHRVRTSGYVVRIEPTDRVYGMYAAFELNKSLARKIKRRRRRYAFSFAALVMAFMAFTMLLMQVESAFSFGYNRVLYCYSLIAAAFLLSRYLFGAMYRSVPVNAAYTPGVTVVIPCYNEGQTISRTIISCVNQDYPIDRLEVIVVDDCSADRSVDRIAATLLKLYGDGDRYKTSERVRLIVQDTRQGKRAALARGAELAKHELVVFADSDCLLAPTAIKNLVQPFQDPRMGGVTGRADVENKYTNLLTRLQSARGYVLFRVMKAAEAYFDCVTSLSGPITCYRRDLVLRFQEQWINRRFLCRGAGCEDGKSMASLMMKEYRTGYQDTAVCTAMAPSSARLFMKRQAACRRSWLRESFLSARHVWRKEPFMAIFFYIGFLLPITAPWAVLFLVVIAPIASGVFPTVFFAGLLTLIALLSIAELLLRKSALWLFGLLFGVLYEIFLLCQVFATGGTGAASHKTQGHGCHDLQEADAKPANRRARKKGA